MTDNFESKILVVDDDKYNTYILKEILSEKFRVESVGNAKSAIAMTKEFRPDLILLDVILPDVDGLELCRLLKSSPDFGFIKIILVSAKSQIGDRLEGYDAGADDYICKPFEKEELLAKVNVFLRLKHVEEVERLKEDVISLFSHEVKTPLNSISGFAELLESTTALDEKQKEIVSHIIINSKELLSLTEKSILLNSIRTNSKFLPADETGSAQLLDEVVKSRQWKAGRKKIRIVKNIRSDFKLSCDSKLVFEAIGALLDNALKFSSTGSSVLISADKEKENSLFIVRDEGEGFPGDFDKILSEKPREKDINYHGRGYGIGLAFVKYVAELHNGSLKLLDTGKHGSAVELRLPLCNSKPKR